MNERCAGSEIESFGRESLHDADRLIDAYAGNEPTSDSGVERLEPCRTVLECVRAIHPIECFESMNCRGPF